MDEGKVPLLRECTFILVVGHLRSAETSCKKYGDVQMRTILGLVAADAKPAAPKAKRAAPIIVRYCYEVLSQYKCGDGQEGYYIA